MSRYWHQTKKGGGVFLYRHSRNGKATQLKRCTLNYNNKNNSNKNNSNNKNDNYDN